MKPDYYKFYSSCINSLTPEGEGQFVTPTGNLLNFFLTTTSLLLNSPTGYFTSFYVEMSRSKTMKAALFSRWSNGTPFHPDFRAGQFLRVAVPYFNPDYFLADWLINQHKGMSTYGEEYMKNRQLGHDPFMSAFLTGCGQILDELGYIPTMVDENTTPNMVLAHFGKPRY